MISKTITYEDYNGNSKTETFYFNLSKADLLKLQLRHHNNLQGELEDAVKNEDAVTMCDIFEEFIGLAFGERVDDGFVKDKKKTAAFVSSEAYSELLVELLTVPEAGNEFITGIIPAKLAAEMANNPEYKKLTTNK